MLNITKLQNAVKILDQIKKLDAEIIQIEKIAETVANGNSVNTFTLQIQDLAGKIGTGQNILDSDGSLNTEEDYMTAYFRRMTGRSIFSTYLGTESRQEKKPVFTHELTNEISESSVLGILGILLFDKQDHRQRLINSLKKKGFEL